MSTQKHLCILGVLVVLAVVFVGCNNARAYYRAMSREMESMLKEIRDDEKASEGKAKD